jgi:hypothetical protein
MDKNKNKNKNKTPSEPRLDADLPVEDESAEQVTGGLSKPHSKPRSKSAHTTRANFAR